MRSHESDKADGTGKGRRRTTQKHCDSRCRKTHQTGLGAESYGGIIPQSENLQR